MMSLNRRRTWVAGIAAVGAVLVAAPTVQAQGSTQPQVDRARDAIVRSGLLKSAPADAKSTLAGKSAALAGKSAAKAAEADEVSACTVTGYSPTKIAIGASVKQRNFLPKVTGCTLAAYTVVVGPFTSDDENSLDGVSLEFHPTADLDPRHLLNAWAGKQEDAVYVEAWGEGEDLETVAPAIASFPFQILRRASFGSSFNASPEPVKKGKKITIKGTLERVNFNQAKSLKYKGFSGAPVEVQFKADGTSGYKTVKTVDTGSGGKVSTTIKATKSGKWRLYFGGYTTTDVATSGVDAVKVK